MTQKRSRLQGDMYNNFAPSCPIFRQNLLLLHSTDNTKSSVWRAIRGFYRFQCMTLHFLLADVKSNTLVLCVCFVLMRLCYVLNKFLCVWGVNHFCLIFSLSTNLYMSFHVAKWSKAPSGHQRVPSSNPSQSFCIFSSKILKPFYSIFAKKRNRNGHFICLKIC